ncbi:uncharacterized protein LOC116415764 isoform X2 [Nasonia vitripennis]|uniref:Uncharacterized protein n=1 Tax=Nasonia vitripennis TaxID=7425 RepID=A0A7M7PTU2_NASVI|nr:uncharacterized protein LOC116415764 isoform X2 [Nasonia vitripennis]
MLKHLQSQHPFFFQTTVKEVKTKSTKRPLEDYIESPPSTSIHPPQKKAKTDAVKQQPSLSKYIGIKDIFARINSFKDGGFQSNQVSNAILYMICKDMLPISIVEFEGFNKLMSLVAPLYKVPSKRTMTRNLEARYEIMKNAFIQELENIPYYCLTADNWTDSSTQSYIGVTIHYLNNSKMTGRTIGCFPLYENHTSEYLSKSIEKIFNDFKIKKEKITAMITDAAPNIKKACIDLLGKDKHLI